MMPCNLLLLSCFFLLPFAVVAGHNPSPPIDSTKYSGYRLELTNFKKIKEKDDWLRISFTVVNTGKMNVDMGRKGTEHWVVFNFDKSIFQAKLGGYRENIKRQLAKDGFQLDAGKMILNMELKIPNVLPAPPKQPALIPDPVTEETIEPPPVEQAANNLSWQAYNTASPQTQQVEISEKDIKPEPAPCPDIVFSGLKIIKQDDKYATVQYTLSNQGEGVFYLFGKNGNPAIHAFLSGVTILTRGALPISSQELTEEIRSNNQLKKGESVTAQMKIDIRKKTRYMKSLILSIDGPQFAEECDRTNNSLGVVLE